MSHPKSWIKALGTGALVLLAVSGVTAQGAGQQKIFGSPGTQSAKSDCSGEAIRRGYTVLSTGNFQQYRDGWSLDLRLRDARGRESTGSCFVETRTGDVSLYGFAWGSDGGSGESLVFNCASIDQKYRECQLPVDGSARIVKRVSDSPCVEGRSWGQRGDRVWVDQGCRAQFEVVRGGSGDGAGGAGKVDCRPKSSRYSECAIARGYIGRLERDYSGSRCSEGNWGTSNGIVWVRNGCQGRFVLESIEGGSGAGSAGQQQRAEAQCRSEGRRRGIDVRNVASARWRGTFWETTLDGYYGGSAIRAGCRFFPESNRTEVTLGGT
jgi:hypothetical protein